MSNLVDGESLYAGIGNVSAIWVDPRGDRLLVVDQATNSLRLVRKNPTTL